MRYLKRYSDHPYLVTIILLGVATIAVAALLDTLILQNMYTDARAFAITITGLFGIMFVIVGLLGYVLLFLAKYGAEKYEQAKIDRDSDIDIEF